MPVKRRYITIFCLMILGLALYLNKKPQTGPIPLDLAVVDQQAPPPNQHSPEKIALFFEQNTGQTDPQVQYLSRGQGYTLFLTQQEAVLKLQKADSTSQTLKMHLPNANPTPTISGESKQAGKSNYFIGNDPDFWKTDVPHFGKVKYHDIYDGIDLVYYGNQRRLEYDFIVSPGTDPSQIQIQFDGAQDISLADNGDLILQTENGHVVQQRPITYQIIDGIRHDIDSDYILEGNSASFRLASYNLDHDLIIDPILSYSSYLGGSSDEQALDLALDGSNNIYLSGRTLSTNFPGAGSSTIQSSNNGSYDVFVTKLSADGSSLIYSTYLGGSGSDEGRGLAVDASGNAYVTGETTSSNYPTLTPYQGSSGGGADAFITKINAAGSSLLYSTYLGGINSDQANSIVVDGSGDVYLTGSAGAGFPTSNAIYGSNSGSADVFIARMNAAGSSLVFSTFVGGSGSDGGQDIELDSGGNIYVVGLTQSSNFPIQNEIQSFGGVWDAVIVKLNNTGSTLQYSTFLGATGNDQGYAIAVNNAGNAFITGLTQSTNFPGTSTTPIQSIHGDGGGTNDAFIAKISTAGSSVEFATYLGGSGGDYGSAIWVGSSDDIYVAGQTAATNFPIANPFQNTNGGGTDAFVAHVDATGNYLHYASYLGGSGTDYPNEIALDSSGNPIVVGYTASTNFTTKSPYQSSSGGSSDAFVTKLAPSLFNDISQIAGIHDAGGTRESKTSAWADYDGDGDLDLFFSNSGGADRLFRNDGNDTFSEVGSSANVAATSNNEGAAWGDYDNDGDLDLYVGAFSFGNNLLYRNNGNGTFTEVGSSANVNDNGGTSGVAWGDYNNDGHLDLYVANCFCGSQPATNRLYQNSGSGTFSEVGGSAGVASANESRDATWADYDDDGDLDLFVPSSGAADHLYRNDGNGSFTDRASNLGVATGGTVYSGAWGDFDRDNDLDLYVVINGVANKLYRNDGASFNDIGLSSGTDDSGNGRASVWVDYNNDGLLDLHLLNGSITNNGSPLFRNNGNNTFTDVAVESGINYHDDISGAAWGDYDNDGDLDAFISIQTTGQGNLLYKNGGNTNQWLKANLTGTASNRAAIGAKVFAVAGGAKQRLDVDAGAGYKSTVSLPIEFGFGATNTVDSLIVVWPSGLKNIQTNVATNQTLNITEPASPTFTDVAATLSVNDGGNGRGAAWGDSDGDGDLDLYVANDGSNSRLYRNDAGTFNDIASAAGVTNGSSVVGFGLAWGDYDNDGDLDLHVVNNGGTNNRLYRNDGNNAFNDVASSTGTAGVFGAVDASWVDYDIDGDLDLYVIYNTNASSKLLRNNGGTFTDESSNVNLVATGNSRGGAWADYDDDGDLDVYVTNNNAANLFYRNDGGTFQEVGAASGVNDSGSGRGLSWGDYDGDGDLDLYLANQSPGPINKLFQNNGNGTFNEVGNAAGVDHGGEANGAVWTDLDNDGDLDLYVGDQPNKLYSNNGDGTFADISGASGADDAGSTFGVAIGDYDNDGDLDIYNSNHVGSNTLYQNDGNSNRWLQIKLTGTTSTKNSVGAKVTAVTGTERQRWDVNGGAAFLSKSSFPVEFGFGATTTVDSLIVQWPSGLVQTQTNVSTNQVLAITEQGAFSNVASSFGISGSADSYGAAWGDYDGDNDLDLFVTNSFTANNLYRNDGPILSDIASGLGLADTGDGRAASWADYDNDGDLDLYVTQASSNPNRLYRNEGNATFTEVGSTSGVNHSGGSQSICWGDYNNDGYIDVFVSSFTGVHLFYQNNGDGSFTNIAPSTGISGIGNRGAAAGDFDEDGDLDIYINWQSAANDALYRNNNDGTFSNIASGAGIANNVASFGASWLDYDNDRDLDLYVSNQGADRLYRNNGNNTFTDVAATVGINSPNLSQGNGWADNDNDGDIDIYVATTTSNQFYQNDGTGHFVDITTSSGVDDTNNTLGAAWGDFDADGDLDLFLPIFTAENKLLRNNNDSVNNWLNIALTGVLSNKAAIGTKVTAISGLKSQRRDIDGGSGRQTQPSLPIEFGFGTTSTIDSLIIQWPSGIIWDTTNVATNQILSLTEFVELVVTVPDTISNYASTINVPIRIEGAANKEIVAAEINLAYDSRIITSALTEITGTLVATGWSVEENIFQGSGDIDTLSIAMSTAQDTLNSDGDLILLTFQTADIRHPDSTALELTKVLFNDGTPLSTNNSGSLKLIGTDGTITANPDSINPGDVVSITVTDTDLDLDVGNPDQVTATAVSKEYNDSQSVTLTETGANTGVFTGTVNTIFALAAGPSNDGVITTIAGDSICVSFVDSLTSVGTTVTRYDTVEVIGGTDGEVLASFVVQSLDGRNGVRDTVRVQITDSDLDTDVGLAEQVSATITNSVSGETEAVTLTETGVNTGIFQVRVPTISGASGTNNDGELSLASEDTLTATYVDALTSQGGSSPIQDNTQVVNLFGDVRSNDNVQAFDAASILAHAVSLNTYTARDSLLGDVDGNNDIQAFDASQVLQYVVRLINRFPVQTDGTLNPPADPKNHPFLKPVPLNHIIALGELQPQGDGTHVMPISLTDREGILSATLEIAHSEHIQVTDVTTNPTYDGFMVAHNAEKDRVRIAFAGAQSHVSGSGDLFYLHIKATGDLQFSLDHVVLNGHTLTPSAPLEIITQAEPATPLIYALHQNHPNPFNPETVIRYDLPEASDLRIMIYNVVGQQIRTLLSVRQESGAHQVIWNAKDDFGRDVSSGVYFLIMEAGEFKHVRKMMLLR